MSPAEMQELYAQHHRPGFGTLTVDELAAVQDVIADLRPRSFLELGTASGLSAGFFCRMLEEHGGERFVTVDQLGHFYNDPAREAGFVIPSLYPGGTVQVDRRTFTNSLSLPGSKDRFDLAFIDAGHAHPWPLIDALCIGTVLDGPRLILLDDLTLFRRRRNGRGVGPKFLFDQFPESHRWVYDTAARNLGAVSMDIGPDRLERIASDAFSLPWTLHSKISAEDVDRLTAILTEHYSPSLASVFLECAAVFNVPNGRYLRKQA